MKSPYCGNSNSCVDATIRPYADEDHVVLTDTASKTGKGVYLLFDEDEWKDFVRGVKDGAFDWDALQAQRRLAARRVAGTPVAPDTSRRTPENLAYVNGQYAERNGWVPLTFERFCRKFTHDVNDDKSRSLYDAFQTGRRAEAHEKSMREGH